MTLATWLTLAALSWTAPADWDHFQTLSETAHAIAAEVQDPSEAALLMSIATTESGGFDPKVDTCEKRGDHGRARSVLQVWPIWDVPGEDVCKDRRAAVRAAMRAIAWSRRLCGRGPYQLAGYTSGSCGREPRAGWYLRRARVWTKGHPFHPETPALCRADGCQAVDA